MSLQEFAAGVIRVVNANMEKAIRVVSIERGYDPRRFALVAFGGAGAMHACELAASLRIPRVIVPAYPGALSALGILISDVVKDHSRTVLLQTRGKSESRSPLPVKELTRIYAELNQRIGAELKKENWKGRVVVERSADLRYRGQGYEINLNYGNDLLERFHAEHKRRYGYSTPQAEVEIVTLRLRARVASPERLSRMKIAAGGEGLRPSVCKAWFGGKWVKSQVLPRAGLKPGRRYRGPSIITEYSATIVVPPGFTFQADKASNLLVEVG
jgi:N-methylhydantoinase A